MSSVLVIEPHADYRAEIVAALLKQRFECDGVSSLQEALIKLRDHRYECILLDVDSALVEEEVASLVSSEKNRDSLVLITDADPDEQRVFLDGVAYPLLRKPFERTELLGRTSLTARRETDNIVR